MTGRFDFRRGALALGAAVIAMILALVPAAMARPAGGADHGNSTAPGQQKKDDNAQSDSAKGNSDHDGDADSDSSTAYNEDNDTNDGNTPNNQADDGDNAHPSGKDRSVEHGNSGNQGKSESDPDDNGNGPDRSNGGPDKPNGSGGVDKADQDGNNGCGNDDDFEDDNEGWCGGKPKPDKGTTDEGDDVEGSHETPAPQPCGVDSTMPNTADECGNDDETCDTDSTMPNTADECDTLGDDTETCDTDSTMPNTADECDTLGSGTDEGDSGPTDVEGTPGGAEGGNVGSSVLGKQVRAAQPRVAAVSGARNVAAAAAAPGGAVLAYTGANVLPLLLIGLVLVLTGWALLRARGTN